MSDPTFTILLPVHRPPAMLPFAIASVLAQERRDFELFVICDGTPPETVACAQEFAARDPRVRVFAHPKGERNGELYRDQALREARGKFVCQLGDDDLWLPNHLGEMEKLLEDVDFGHLPQVEVTPDGLLKMRAGTLCDAGIRQKMLTRRFNIFGPTVAGYRLDAYRSLPQRWSPAPRDIHSDLFMWRKFLAQSGLRFGARIAVTSLKFANSSRAGWSIERRREELSAWVARLSVPGEHDRIVQAALRRFSQSAFDLDLGKRQLRKMAKKANRADKLFVKLQKTRQSWSWRLTRPFRTVARRIRRLAAR
ncbi:MAG: glycosyltransferase family 2 protein [Rhodospirillaceae bacterium]|nr:glycosyltransferase family 2 protein [Rhodospirillaceae bacterium]